MSAPQIDIVQAVEAEGVASGWLLTTRHIQLNNAGFQLFVENEHTAATVEQFSSSLRAIFIGCRSLCAGPWRRW
jgi:hypothetical protein